MFVYVFQSDSSKPPAGGSGVEVATQAGVVVVVDL